MPSAAGRDGQVKRLATRTITITITPALNANPQKNPPRLGMTAAFNVSYSESPGSCSSVTVRMTVAGPNGTVKQNATGAQLTYVGLKAGVDTVTFSIAGTTICSGTTYFEAAIVGRKEFTVPWAQDFWHMGLCSVKTPPPGQGAAWVKMFRAQCVDDPVAEGLGIFQTSVIDAKVDSPGVPFILERTYNSNDDRGLFSGVGWSFPYLTTIGGDTNGVIQFYGFNGQRYVFEKKPDGTWAPLNGQTVTLTQVSNTYTLKFADGTVWTYSGSSLTSITKNGQVTRVQPGLYGSTSSVTLANGKRIAFSYDSNFNLSRVTLPDGRYIGYSVNMSGDLAAVTDLRGGITRYTYDQYHRLLTITDPRGNVVVRNTYNSTNRLATQTDALGNVTTYSYAIGCLPVTYAICTPPVVTTTDARGNQWVNTYSVEGNLVSSRDPLGNTATWTYDPATGDPTSYTSPLGNTISYVSDANHDVTQTTLPGPVTTSATYNTSKLLATATNGLGYTTSYTYDTNGNPTQIALPGSATVGMTYNAAGQLSTVTDETSRTTTYGYNAAGDLTSTTSPLGNKTTYGYDTFGRMSSIVEPRGNVTGGTPANYTIAITYDGGGDLVKTVTDPLGRVTTYGYDADGNLTSKTDANNHTWTYTYDAANRLTKVTAPDLTTTTYAYDAVGNLTSRTDANGHATLYTYDSANRLIKIVDPLAREWVLGYDADSNLITVATPSGGTIGYTYDAIGRRTGINYSDGTPPVGFSYDADGNRATMTDGSGTTTYGYDNRDRLTGVTHGTDAFSYTYDAAGRIASRTYPDATQTTYTYDSDGRMSSATTGSATTSYQYDAAGNLTQITLPNGVVESATFDRAGRVTQVNDGFRVFAYGYDNGGNVTSRTIGTVTTTYAYDTLDRLTDAVTGTATTHYGYDAVGNRTSLSDASGVTTFNYDVADELLSAAGPSGTASHGHDANGNITGAGAWAYTVNLAGQLTAATDGTTSVTYAYDGDGNRTSQSAGGTSTSLLWDPNFGLPQLALERDNAGGLLRRYTYGQGRISMTTPSTTAYYSSDALGSVTEISSIAGASLGRFDRGPFGESETGTGVASSVTGNPFAFTGEYRDPVTGLYNLRARNYDTVTGRFLTPDPLGRQDYASTYPGSTDWRG